MEIGVCGVLVHTRPTELEPVRDALAQMPGVEVHATTQEGRMVVTVEDTGETKIFETITGFHDIRGVLSASLIYGHSEKLEPEQELES